jgi:hypothetical protein
LTIWTSFHISILAHSSGHSPIFTEYTVSTLCAVGFVVCYFVFTLVLPIGKPLPVSAEAHKFSCLGSVALIIWAMLFSAVMFLSTFLRGSYSQLFQAAQGYSVAGMLFAWASNCINAMRKV